jgi:hypothetical protein
VDLYLMNRANSIERVDVDPVEGAGSLLLFHSRRLAS